MTPPLPSGLNRVKIIFPLLYDSLFDILSVFTDLLQLYFYIYFFHTIFLYIFLHQIILYIYIELVLAIFPCCFCNILLLFLFYFADGNNFPLVVAIFLCFFDNKYKFFIYAKKKFNSFNFTMICFFLLKET